jgi:hypothetical protein
LGFLAKSVFWLGLVYSAMPFDAGTLVREAPATAVLPAAIRDSAAICGKATAEACLGVVDELRKAAELVRLAERAVPTPPARPRPPGAPPAAGSLASRRAAPL